MPLDFGNISGRVFGMKRYRGGVDKPSASGMNELTTATERVANIAVSAPLTLQKNGVGIRIGISSEVSQLEVAYPCRVVEPRLDNEPMTPAQLGQFWEPDRLKYMVRPDPNARGDVPQGIDFSQPMAVKYGRPFGSAVKVKASVAGDLCFVSSKRVDATTVEKELWILREVLGTKACQSSTNPDSPPGTGQSFSSLRSEDQPPSQDSIAMPTSETSESFTLDANASDPAYSEPFYVGDADYAAVSALWQEYSVKGGWPRSVVIEWSFDKRVWSEAKFTDPTAGTKGQAKLSADGGGVIDCRECIVWLRAKWDNNTSVGSTTLVDMLWTKKSGVAKGT